jgi:DNA-binding response OmpR family regulator
MKIGVVSSELNTLNTLEDKSKSNYHFSFEFCNLLSQKQLEEIEGVLIFKDEKIGIREVCEWMLKAVGAKLPVWIVGDDKNREERIIYLQMGAVGIFGHDYLPEEILLSIKNNQVHLAEESLIGETKEIKLNSQNCSVIFNQNEIELTRIEYKVMDLLFQNKKTVCTYEQIAEQVWIGEVTEYKAQIANIISHLRNKFVKYDQSYSESIKTVRSRGYLFDDSMIK